MSCQVQLLLRLNSGTFFCTVTESVTLFPLEFFKCCCLPSLQTTSSSLFFTEKVSRLVCSSSWQIFPRCALFTVFAFTLLGDDKGSCFSFLRFIDVSPAEMSNLMLQGTLVRWVLVSSEKRRENTFSEWFSSSFFPFFYRWLALFLSLKAAYRLHHQRLFGLQESADLQGSRETLRSKSKCLSRRDLILWPNRPTSFPNTHTSPVLQVRLKSHIVAAYPQNWRRLELEGLMVKRKSACVTSQFLLAVKVEAEK